MCVCTLQLSLYGIVALHVNTLVCVRQQRITKHDIVAPTGVAERALLCLGRAGCFGSNWRRCRSSMSGLLRQQLEAMQRQYGDAGQQQQQRWGGGQHYQQPQRQQQQQHAGTCWVGNTARGWYQPESSPPPGASMRGVFKCERCGALEHKAASCRALNAFPWARRTCGEYGHMSRQCRIACNHAHVIAAMPPAMHWLPSAFAE